MSDRAAGFLRARLALRHASIGAHVYVGGPIRVVGPGVLEIGDRAVFHGGIIPSELRVERGARLTIGAECVFNYGVSMEAHQEIRIGRRCMMGSLSRLADRGPRGTAPIVVEDDVWIAHGAILEPGVTIGAGSIVSAGSVVTADVPPGSLAIGNPARSLSLGLVSAGAS